MSKTEISSLSGRGLECRGDERRNPAPFRRPEKRLSGDPRRGIPETDHEVLKARARPSAAVAVVERGRRLRECALRTPDAPAAVECKTTSRTARKESEGATHAARQMSELCERGQGEHAACLSVPTRETRRLYRLKGETQVALLGVSTFFDASSCPRLTRAGRTKRICPKAWANSMHLIASSVEGRAA